MRINGHEVGPGYPVYVIAEGGSNHEGSLATALKITHWASWAGAQAIKWQMFRADRLYPEGGAREAARRWELPEEWLTTLRDRAHTAGLDFIVTPFDEESADILEPYVDAYKIASLDFTNEKLVGHVAAKAKPMIVSTGAATAFEVRELVNKLDRDVALLHCTIGYPALATECNLASLRQMWWLGADILGLSDHTAHPWRAAIAATVLQASIIEKHIRLDGQTASPDASFAITPSEFREMVTEIRACEVLLGDGRKRVMLSEEPMLALRRGPRGLRGA